MLLTLTESIHIEKLPGSRTRDLVPRGAYHVARGMWHVARGGEECTLPETKGRPHLSVVGNKRDRLTKRVSRSSIERGEGCFGQRRGLSPLSRDSMECALVIGNP